MKKKIIFVTNYMMMGGIERALISMLEQIPEDHFDVTLLIVHPGGELFDKIPKHVKIKTLFNHEKRLIERVWENMKKGKFIYIGNLVIYSILLKWGKQSQFNQFEYFSKIKPIDTDLYDIAVSYSILDSLPIVYVAKNINARRKIVWIHSDISDLGNQKYTPFVKQLMKHYRLYDHIFCVSQYAVKVFKDVFQNLSSNVSVFYNIIDKNKIKMLSIRGNSYEDRFKGIRILTVGRISKEKGQDLIPPVLLKLISKGYNIRWYCIGDGPDRLQIEKMIAEYRLEKHLILLGTKDNPYPYIRECDLYVQPSRHEAYCISVAEARTLYKPIIITNTGAGEQIIHEQNGLIVAFDQQQMYESIVRLIEDQRLKTKLINNLMREDVDTKTEMKKLYAIAE